MAKLKITQVKSGIAGTHRQRETLKSLGLRRGMIATVAHLVTVEEVN